MTLSIIHKTEAHPRRKLDHKACASFKNFRVYCLGGNDGDVVELLGDPASPPMQWRTGPDAPWRPCRVGPAKIRPTTLSGAERAPAPACWLATYIAPADMALLRALRAGPLDSSQMAERWPTSRPNTAKLQFDGLIHKTGNTHESIYELTSAGLRACEPRNPASAKPRRTPLAGPDVRNPTGIFAAGRYLRE